MDVVLGDGCEIGAGSVVTRNLPSFAIGEGLPGVMIGIRRTID